jgi:hypothetical protein
LAEILPSMITLVSGTSCCAISQNILYVILNLEG